MRRRINSVWSQCRQPSKRNRQRESSRFRAGVFADAGEQAICKRALVPFHGAQHCSPSPALSSFPLD